ncbi:hypothetical protein WJX73_000804 [Symbiochloris irregularis]|uniref:Uncharacterized protein n=1 Tax=Symbiochloris irregularis TaxID=706552 RepID=A0AAW1PFP5_9CHLO
MWKGGDKASDAFAAATRVPWACWQQAEQQFGLPLQGYSGGFTLFGVSREYCFDSTTHRLQAPLLGSSISADTQPRTGVTSRGA